MSRQLNKQLAGNFIKMRGIFDNPKLAIIAINFCYTYLCPKIKSECMEKIDKRNMKMFKFDKVAVIKWMGCFLYSRRKRVQLKCMPKLERYKSRC